MRPRRSGGACCSAPSRRTCWCASQLTPPPGGANWPSYAVLTSTAAYWPSSGDSPAASSAQRRPGGRRLTLEATRARLIKDHFDSWAARGPEPVGDWLFAPTPARHTYVTAGALSHKFRVLGRHAGVDAPALHRLRHGVATLLVDEGKVLKTQARLGHRDPATTLRHYSHVLALHDEDVADELDTLLNGR